MIALALVGLVAALCAVLLGLLRATGGRRLDSWPLLPVAAQAEGEPASHVRRIGTPGGRGTARGSTAPA